MAERYSMAIREWPFAKTGNAIQVALTSTTSSTGGDNISSNYPN